MNNLSATTLTAARVVPQAGVQDQAIRVFSPGQVPAIHGASECFVGDVYVDQQYQGTAPARISGGLVSFTAGARTAWQGSGRGPLDQTVGVSSDGSHWPTNGSAKQPLLPIAIASPLM